jgi:hypothetical protein
MAGGQTVTVDASGYVTAGYLSGNAQNVYYGTHITTLQASSLARFYNDSVTEGSLTNNTNLFYNSSSFVSVNGSAVVNFDSSGYLSHCILLSFSSVYYGPSRNVYMKGSTSCNFSGGYVSQGTLYVGTFLTTATGSVWVAANTVCDFLGGYYTP